MARTLTAPAPSAAHVQIYLQLRALWRANPLLYVRQRFGIEPTWQQQQILEAIKEPGAKVSVRSGHGIGKSSCAAFIVLWHLETHDFCKVPCTAPTAHQLRDVLWGELSKWRRQADAQSARRGDPPALYLSQLFHLTQDRLYDLQAPEWSATARTARKEAPEALQGFHAPHLLYIIDEASGVEEPIYEAAEGALSTPTSRVLLLGNPTRTSGTFHASHHKDRGSYTALHFRSQDSPLVDPGYRERLVRRWGEGSNVVKVRADGEFPKQEDDVLISLELTEPCLTRERVDGEGTRVLGVDPARFGSDRTALVLRHGRLVEHIAVHAKLDTMQSVGRVIAAAQAWDAQTIAVDVVGLGAGVYDRLVEVKRAQQLPWTVVAVNVSNPPPPARRGEPRPKRLRDWLWVEMSRWLREDAPVFCAKDRQACEDLAGELASVTYDLDSAGLLIVEDKDHMRDRLGHSPDLADALACCFGAERPWAGRVVIL
jgi:hypothetical protein